MLFKLVNISKIIYPNIQIARGIICSLHTIIKHVNLEERGGVEIQDSRFMWWWGIIKFFIICQAMEQLFIRIIIQKQIFIFEFLYMGRVKKKKKQQSVTTKVDPSLKTIADNVTGCRFLTGIAP